MKLLILLSVLVSLVFASGTGAAAPRQCNDGVDNDTDGKIDYPADLGCSSSRDTSENTDQPPPTPPDTTITNLQDGDSGSNFIDEDGSGDETMVLSFTGTNATSFQCQLGANAWVACASPWSLSPRASVGDHTVRVRGVNSGGPDPTPAERAFTLCPAAGCAPPPPPPPPTCTTPTPFPSRLHVANGHLTDEANCDIGLLRGFNTPYGSWGWSQQHFDDLAAQGMKLIRFVIVWDVIEPSRGAFNMADVGYLDTSIARAKAAGIYSLLELHLNVGRVPAWANTPGSEWADYRVNGQGITQFLANRYKDEKAVIGFNPNEPPCADNADCRVGYAETVPWFRDIATQWPIWVSPTPYSSGDPFPRNGVNADPSAYLALDTNNRGVVAEYHEYTQSPLMSNGQVVGDGYRDNGLIAKCTQISSIGWHTTTDDPCNVVFPYPDLTTNRSALRLHVQQKDDFQTVGGGRVAVALGEWGYPRLDSGACSYGVELSNITRSMGWDVELWWNYDTTTDRVRNPWAARPGGAWREAVTCWFNNSMPRAN